MISWEMCTIPYGDLLVGPIKSPSIIKKDINDRKRPTDVMRLLRYLAEFWRTVSLPSWPAVEAGTADPGNHSQHAGQQDL